MKTIITAIFVLLFFILFTVSLFAQEKDSIKVSFFEAKQTVILLNELKEQRKIIDIQIKEKKLYESSLLIYESEKDLYLTNEQLYKQQIKTLEENKLEWWKIPLYCLGAFSGGYLLGTIK
jgi:biopolymer transport protein ExbD